MKITSSISSSEKNDLKLLFHKLIIFFPILVMIPLVNFFFDPASIYSHKIAENLAADIVAKGKNVNLGEFPNFNERLFQKYLIQKITKAPTTIILGSSRSMLIGENIFPSSTVLNNSVSSASIEDLLAIFYNYEKQKIIPKRVILSIDPWMFNKNFDLNGWTSYPLDLEIILKKLGVKENGIKKPIISNEIKNLFSLSYFQASLIPLKNFIKGNSGKPGLPFETTEIEGIDTIILKDGRRILSKKDRIKPLSQIRKEAISYGSEKSSGELEGFNEIDPTASTILQKFINYLFDKKIEVVIFLAPFHPETFNRFSQRIDRKIVFQVEEMIKKISKNVLIIGSFDPNIFSLMENDFRDGYHPIASGIKKIFKEHNNSRVKSGSLDENTSI